MTSIEQQTAQAENYPVGVPLHQQVAKFSGLPHQALLLLLSNPDRSLNSIVADIGVRIGTYANWRYRIPEFAATVDAIRANRIALRREAALAILEARTIPIAEAMADRAVGTGRDAQRAGERILETVGVLKKDAETTQSPVQVVTHTYVLVERQPGQEPKPVMVETTAKELPPPAGAPST